MISGNTLFHLFNHQTTEAEREEPVESSDVSCAESRVMDVRECTLPCEKMIGFLGASACQAGVYVFGGRSKETRFVQAALAEFFSCRKWLFSCCFLKGSEVLITHRPRFYADSKGRFFEPSEKEPSPKTFF